MAAEAKRTYYSIGKFLIGTELLQIIGIDNSIDID